MSKVKKSLKFPISLLRRNHTFPQYYPSNDYSVYARSLHNSLGKVCPFQTSINTWLAGISVVSLLLKTFLSSLLSSSLLDKLKRPTWLPTNLQIIYLLSMLFFDFSTFSSSLQFFISLTFVCLKLLCFLFGGHKFWFIFCLVYLFICGLVLYNPSFVWA